MRSDNQDFLWPGYLCGCKELCFRQLHPFLRISEHQTHLQTIYLSNTVLSFLVGHANWISFSICCCFWGQIHTLISSWFLFQEDDTEGRSRAFVVFLVSLPLLWLEGRSFAPFIHFSVSAAMRPVLPEEVWSNPDNLISLLNGHSGENLAASLAGKASLILNGFQKQISVWLCQVLSRCRRPLCFVPFCPKQGVITLALGPSRDAIQMQQTGDATSF